MPVSPLGFTQESYNTSYLTFFSRITMSAAALSVLISQLRELVDEYKAKRSQLENQPMRRPTEKSMEIDSDEEPDEEAADTKLQEAFLSLKKKIELVKKSVPEGAV